MNKRFLAILILISVVNLVFVALVVWAIVKPWVFKQGIQPALPIPVQTIEEKATSNTFEAFREEKMNLPVISGEVSVIAVGDVMLSRTVEEQMLRYGMDLPFQEMAGILQSADITFGNLETSITPGRIVQPNQMYFRAHPESADALARAGFDIVTLANNHAQNFGNEGLLDTFKYLDDAGVKYTGAGETGEQAYGPVYLGVGDQTVAFLSYTDPNIYGAFSAADETPGLAIMDEEKMRTAIANIPDTVQSVIVSMHAGTEYTRSRTPAQESFARAAIEAGADVVIGHHPHWVQPIEDYEGDFIFYSLGNFVFDQMWSRKTQEGLLTKLYLGPSGLKKFELVPVLIEQYAKPRELIGEEADAVLADADIETAVRPVFQWNSETATFEEYKRPVVRLQKEEIGRKNKTQEADTDQDSVIETYTLLDGELFVTEGQTRIWHSEEDWWVDDFVIADADGDGKENLTFSFWRSGDFGSSQPTWIEENDMSVKNHFAVYELNKEMEPTWVSSNLDAPNCEYVFANVDEDPEQELVVIEGTYGDEPLCEGVHAAVWKWNQWGFTNIWRSAPGAYEGLTIESGDPFDHFLVDRF